MQCVMCVDFTVCQARESGRFTVRLYTTKTVFSCICGTETRENTVPSGESALLRDITTTSQLVNCKVWHEKLINLKQ